MASVDEKMLELMRALTAAQAALLDVIARPDAPSPRVMLGIMVDQATQIEAELTPKRRH